MKSQEIKGSSTLGLLFYEKMRVFQSSVEYLSGISIYLNYILVLCMLAFISHSFQMLDPAVPLHFFKIKFESSPLNSLWSLMESNLHYKDSCIRFIPEIFTVFERNPKARSGAVFKSQV